MLLVGASLGTRLVLLVGASLGTRLVLLVGAKSGNETSAPGGC